MNITAKSLAGKLLQHTSRIGHELRSVALLIGPEAWQDLRCDERFAAMLDLSTSPLTLCGAQVQITGEARFYRLAVWSLKGDGRIVAEGELL